MFEKLEVTVKRYEELAQLLSDPAVFADPESLRTYAKEQAELKPVVEMYREYCKGCQEQQDNEELLENEALEVAVGDRGQPNAETEDDHRQGRPQADQPADLDEHGDFDKRHENEGRQ